jgi:hypothetical protein
MIPKPLKKLLKKQKALGLDRLSLPGGNKKLSQESFSGS